MVFNEGLVLCLVSNMFPVDPRLPEELNSLLSSNPPPFIYINDPTSPRIATTALLDVLAAIPLVHVHVDAVACFTSRLFFDRVLHGLNLSEGKHNANLDAFLYGLKLAHAKLPKGARIVIVIEQVDRLKDRLPDLVVPLTRLSEMVSSLWLIARRVHRFSLKYP